MIQQKKKLFFLVPFYMNMYKDIQNELEKFYDVFIFEDISIKSKFNLPDTLVKIKKTIRSLYIFFYNPWEKYWSKLIKNNQAFNLKYDYFFCIDGVSLHPILIKHLKSLNPSIKTILYLWDITTQFNIVPCFKYFNSIFTFDYRDAKRYNLKYLPIYWVDRNISTDLNKKKGVFFFGSNHDDRYFIIKKTIKQLDILGYPYHIRIVVLKGKPPNLISISELIYYILTKNKERIEYWKVFYNKLSPKFIGFDFITPAKYDSLIEEYSCVLDTERPNQTGLTPRAIWALAKNKKLITTNKYIINDSLYDPNKILIIDRKDPKITLEFLEREIDTNISKDLENLRIDNWVKQIFI
jgi:hypothetical protein